MKKKMNKRNGFTLIEIIISISLLLMIATYGMLKYQNVKETAQQKLDISNAVTFAETIEMALMEEPDLFKGTNEINSNDSRITKYFHSDLSGKSKAYYGPFKAIISASEKDNKTHNLIIKSNGGVQLYPIIKDTKTD